MVVCLGIAAIGTNAFFIYFVWKIWKIIKQNKNETVETLGDAVYKLVNKSILCAVLGLALNIAAILFK